MKPIKEILKTMIENGYIPGMYMFTKDAHYKLKNKYELSTRKR